FHSKSDRIFRVTRQATISGQRSAYAASNYSLADLMIEHIPEVEHVTRIGTTKGWVATQDKSRRFEERQMLFAEPSFFDVFDVQFLAGNASTALTGPNKVVITKATAEKYFGQESPMGKSLSLDFKRTFVVTGVVEAWKHPSHFNFDFLVSMQSTETDWYSKSMFEHWGNLWTYTYTVARPGSGPEQLRAQISRVAYEFGPPVLESFEVSFPLQPLTSIHLSSDISGEIRANGSKTFLQVFIAVGVLILLIACFNFVNLSTARSSWRAKEVGMKKILGIDRRRLISQFLGESVLLTMLSALLAIAIVAGALPYFSAFSGKDLTYASLFSWDLLLVFLGILLLVGLSAGSFPAFFLSSFRPLQVLKGNNNIGDSKMASRLRKGLVVLQFAISMGLVVSSIAIYHQLSFARNMDLGLDKEQVIVVDFYNRQLREQLPLLRDQYQNVSGVASISATSDTPPRQLNSWWMSQKKVAEQRKDLIPLIAVDHDFVETMGMEIVEGRDFSRDFITDEGGGILINEAMVKFLGMEDPVGAVFDMSEGTYDVQVLGVVRDFHFASIRDEIQPVMLFIHPQWHDHLLLLVSEGNYQATIDQLRSIWEETIPDWQFSYHFLDEDFDKAYKEEQMLSTLVITFSGLAILIGILGLLGLANYTAEQKMKEIGIRKVLGARISQVIWVQYASLVALAAIAFIISVPISYYFLEGWLSQFAYRTSLSWWMWGLGGLLTLAVSLSTVSWQSLKTALLNPVDVLRSE
ncbi:MAG: ABC transporter permease, partial [Bacteroidota bacterium]